MSAPGSYSQTDRLREIPLEAVLRASGAQPDPHDMAKWHTSHGVLSVNGMKFINWNLGRGGGGAIDLAMYLNTMNFRAALAWLAQRFPSGVSSPATRGPKPSFTLPPPDPAQLFTVRRYLTSDRRLPALLVEPLIQAGQIYADPRANAVFLLLGKEQRAVGAELRGTTTGICWRGLASGSRKDLGYFSAGPALSSDVILCESAIDAISCAALYPVRRCISTAGARPNPLWLTSLFDKGCRISCGFDADPTGDQMATTMIAQHPAVQRLRPCRHDWNDVLIAAV